MGQIQQHLIKEKLEQELLYENAFTPTMRIPMKATSNSGAEASTDSDGKSSTSRSRATLG
jgi:hypothetical protein